MACILLPFLVPEQQPRGRLLLARVALRAAVLAAAVVACGRPSSGPAPARPASAPPPAARGPTVAAEAHTRPGGPEPAPNDLRPDPAAPAATGAPAVAPRPALPRTAGERSVRGTEGLVVSVEAQATRAGVAVLEHGGNAVDAAVAVGYALAVTHPSAGNIGGGGFMLVRSRKGNTAAIDFRETAPSGLGASRYRALVKVRGDGGDAIGVPGSVAGLNLAQRRFGRLPLERVVEPAIRLASSGYRIGPRQAKTLRWSWTGLKKNAAARAEFGAPGGGPLRLGRLHRRPELAATLTEIARHGDAGFYRGRVARALAKAVQSAGGTMTVEDLARYRAKLREPLRTRYRGLSVEVMPPPSGGGVVLVAALSMLEQLKAYELERSSWQHLHVYAEVLRRAHTTRRFSLCDPDALSEGELASRERQWKNAMTWLGPHPIDPKHATASKTLRQPGSEVKDEQEQTTHFSVIDHEGMAVSCTMTLSSGFGTKIVAPTTGVVLNNTAAAFATSGDNTVRPGRRPISSMAPTIVLDRGELLLVLGSPGGSTIPSTIVQVLRNIVDYSMPLDEAIDAFRVHHGIFPDHLRFEGQRPPPKAALRGLRLAGHRFSPSRIPMGDANCLLVGDGEAWGYADPREGGLALAAKIEPEQRP